MSDMNPEPRDNVSKANGLAIDALKVLITMVSAILAFTITFLSDVSGGSPNAPAWLLFLLIFSWLLLFFSLMGAYLAIVSAANSLALGESRYLFSKKAESQKPRCSAIFAQSTAIFGMLFLLLYGLVGLYLNFEVSTAAAPMPTATMTPQLSHTPSPTTTSISTPVPTYVSPTP